MTKEYISSSFANRSRFHFHNYISCYPTFYSLYKLIRNKKNDIPSNKVDIVIEGFPRCGNSFAEAAFRVSQAKDVYIIHHTHAPGAIKIAAKMMLPIIILYRNPDDAIASWILRNNNIGNKIFYKDAYNQYIRFYNEIWSVLDSCVVSSFDQTINCFEKTIDQVNSKFQKNFQIFDSNNFTAYNAAIDLVDELSFARKGRTTNYNRKFSKSYLSYREIEKKEIKHYLQLKYRLKNRFQAFDIFYKLSMLNGR